MTKQNKWMYKQMERDLTETLAVPTFQVHSFPHFNHFYYLDCFPRKMAYSRKNGYKRLQHLMLYIYIAEWMDGFFLCNMVHYYAAASQKRAVYNQQWHSHCGILITGVKGHKFCQENFPHTFTATPGRVQTADTKPVVSLDSCCSCQFLFKSGIF